LVLLATTWMGGEWTFLPVILLQAVLHFAIGVMVYAIVAQWWPRYALIALMLTVFNPNALLVAAEPRSDTVFAFFVVAATTAVFAFARRPGWKPALACGIMLGLATNMRPLSEYLIYILPIAFPILAVLSPAKGSPLRAFAMGIVATALAFAIVLPWMLHLQRSGEGLAMTDRDLNWQSVFDVWSGLETMETGVGDTLVTQAHYMQGRGKELAASVPGWKTLNYNEKSHILFKDLFPELSGFRPMTYAKVALHNWKWLLLSGGEGEWFKALGVHSQLDRIRAERPLFFWGSKAWFIGYSLALKLLALLGIWYLVRERRYHLLIVPINLIAYVMLAHGFAGAPRYRIPFEPAIIFLAVCGLAQLSDLWRSRRGIREISS
jgi:4-amino-4-deoxy-L-arabinose transferase-like glycosyltransferase